MKTYTDDELRDSALKEIGTAFDAAITEDVKTIEQRDAFQLVASMMAKRMTASQLRDVSSFAGLDLREPFKDRKPDKPGEWTFQP